MMRQFSRPAYNLSSISKRALGISSIKKAIGKHAANQFIESMELNSKLIVSFSILK